MSCREFCRTLLFAVAYLVATNFPAAAQEPNLTPEQEKQFLLTAKVINSRPAGKGTTSPLRLTLSDGTLTHDAAFQSVDVSEAVAHLASGRTELGFRDSYHFNIAAYQLAELLGLADMMPVTVERKWENKIGSLSWWIHWKWDESMRLKEKVNPPDPEAWNNQMFKIRVFAQLIYDTDRNLGNVLITEDWKIWMIDFTRAFRMNTDLRAPKELMRCDRHLLEKLRQLDAAAVAQKTKGHLNSGEVKALMTRRDKIVELFQKLAAEKGESQVLY